MAVQPDVSEDVPRSHMLHNVPWTPGPLVVCEVWQILHFVCVEYTCRMPWTPGPLELLVRLANVATHVDLLCALDSRVPIAVLEVWQSDR